MTTPAEPYRFCEFCGAGPREMSECEDFRCKPKVASPAEPRRNLARRDRTEDWDMRAATPPASPAERGDAWDRILADPELARARQKLSIHEIRMIVKHAQATPPAPAATDEEVARMVERLEEDANRLDLRAFRSSCTSPDCALAANVARQAADLLARVARERDDLERSWRMRGERCDEAETRATVAEARLAEVEKERDEPKAAAPGMWGRMAANQSKRAERAEAALEKAREALREIVEFNATEPWRITAQALKDIARAALAAMEAGDGK